MKIALLSLLLCVCSYSAESIAPETEPIEFDELLLSLEEKDDFRSHSDTIRRGLKCTQTNYRVRAAQWFAAYGTEEDVPYLIDALSDEFSDGVKYRIPGMDTTRYWANVALIVICKTSYDFQWDSSMRKREYSISFWKQHWDEINLKKRK